MKNEEPTIVADTAYALLKEIADDAGLRELALAVEEAGVPDSQVTKLYLAKLLFSKELYHDFGSALDLVEGVNRRGLYQRSFPKRIKDRIRRGGRARNRTPGLWLTAKNSNLDATLMFRRAVEAVNPFLVDTHSELYKNAVRSGYSSWNGSYVNAKIQLANGAEVSTAVENALRTRREEVGGSGFAIVPVDRYLAFILSGLPYQKSMEGLSVAAEKTRNNCLLETVIGKQVTTRNTLSVSTSFVKKYLEGKSDFGYSREYFEKHKTNVWNDMFSAHAFSLVGKKVNAGAAAGDMWIEVTKQLPSELRMAFLGYEKSVQPFCLLRKTGSDTLGYRTAEFAVYDLEKAERIAMALVEARLAYHARGRHTPKEKVLGQLMMRDLLLQGGSMSSSVPRDRMGQFATVFSSFAMW